jgi:penicillin amidase
MDTLNRFLGPILRSGISSWSRRRLPQIEGQIYAAGLLNKVTVHRDRWGIPRIEARNRSDLFFSQGFIHAQDRLWQMEVNRRAAKGELSELLGSMALETDRLTRTLGFRQIASQTWDNTSQKVRADVAAYTSGVNAYIENQYPLPIEFSLLRHKPSPWDVLDSASFARLMLWTLSHGWAGELTRARVQAKVGPEIAAELEPNYPVENPLTLPSGIEFNHLDIDGMMQAASGPFLSRGMEGSGRGSNGWIIGAGKSSSGHAILCNDVHLPITTPSLWYFNRLSLKNCVTGSPELNITGVSLPGLPYILVGHNDHVAWGATLSYVDCEDLFIEQFDPDCDRYYQVDSTWAEVEVREERIQVKGEDDHTERVLITRHGPVISPVINEKGMALALQSTALLPNKSFEGFAHLNEARNWDEFVGAVKLIESPSLNLLYADVADNIGYFLSGMVPVRPKDLGLVPSPGWKSENDWKGFVPFEEMPHGLNPKDGFLVSANNRLIGDDYPHYLGSLWMNGYRAKRIAELLIKKDRVSISDCAAIQMDLESIPGKALVGCLNDFRDLDDDASQALNILRRWDGWLGADSVGGAVYQVFVAHLSRELLEPLLGPELTDEFLGTGPHPVLVPVTEFHGQWMPTLLHTLQDPSSKLWDAPGGFRRTITRCFTETTSTLRSLFGTDSQSWTWGALHQISFDHLMSQQPPLDRVFGLGPMPIGGDMNTVLQTASAPGDPRAIPSVAPSYRQIVDLGNLRRSRAMYAPGQSGTLGSPHHDDMVSPWFRGEYFQMSTEGEASSGKRMMLVPLSSLPHEKSSY